MRKWKRTFLGTSSPDSFPPDHFALCRSRAWLKGEPARRLIFQQIQTCSRQIFSFHFSATRGKSVEKMIYKKKIIRITRTSKIVKSSHNSNVSCACANPRLLWKPTQNRGINHEKAGHEPFIRPLKVLANEDTLLLMMFLGLRKLGNICCKHKMFLKKKNQKHFLCPGHKFCVRAGKQRNICVGNNVSSFARAFIYRDILGHIQKFPRYLVNI